MLKDSMVAIVTPMKRSGEIDYGRFSDLIDWHLANETDGIVVLGTTGESPTIQPEERRQLIEMAVKQVNGKVPVIAGTGANATQHSIELTQQAKDLGIDAALLVTPYYNKPTQRGLYEHFKTIAEAVSLPQILYNVPARTGSDLLPETVIRLAEVDNIVAIKEATGDISRVKTILDSGCKIDLLTGDDKTSLAFLLAGGQGVVSVVANVVPKLFHDFCVAATQGDETKARKLFAQCEPLCTSLFAESNPIPTKWALCRMGKIEEGIRLPLTPLDEKYSLQVQQALKHAGVNIGGA